MDVKMATRMLKETGLAGEKDKKIEAERKEMERKVTAKVEDELCERDGE